MSSKFRTRASGCQNQKHSGNAFTIADARSISAAGAGVGNSCSSSGADVMGTSYAGLLRGAITEVTPSFKSGCEYQFVNVSSDRQSSPVTSWLPRSSESECDARSRDSRARVELDGQFGFVRFWRVLTVSIRDSRVDTFVEAKGWTTHPRRWDFWRAKSLDLRCRCSNLLRARSLRWRFPALLSMGGFPQVTFTRRNAHPGALGIRIAEKVNKSISRFIAYENNPSRIRVPPWYLAPRSPPIRLRPGHFQ